MVVATVCAALTSPAMADDRPVALVGATLIDGTGAKPIPAAVIVIKNGRFVAAGSAHSVGIPADATRIDATGKYVIPGLMDANVHLYFDIEAEPLIKYAGHYDDLIVEAVTVLVTRTARDLALRSAIS